MTPDTIEATAARYDRWYGTKPGDGGTSDQLRAGAQAMRRVEKLEAKLERSKRLRDQYRAALEVERNHSNPARAFTGWDLSSGKDETCVTEGEWHGDVLHITEVSYGEAAEAKLAAYEETTK